MLVPRSRCAILGILTFLDRSLSVITYHESCKQGKNPCLSTDLLQWPCSCQPLSVDSELWVAFLHPHRSRLQYTSSAPAFAVFVYYLLVAGLLPFRQELHYLYSFTCYIQYVQPWQTFLLGFPKTRTVTNLVPWGHPLPPTVAPPTIGPFLLLQQQQQYPSRKR